MKSNLIIKLNSCREFLRQYQSKSIVQAGNSAKDSAGFTLVELLMYIGIFSILTISLFQLFTLIVDTQKESESGSSVFLDGQYILNRFKYDVNRANSANISQVGVGTSSAQFSIGSQIFTYYLSDGDLILDTSSETASLNSIDSDVSSLNFLKVSDSKGKNQDTITISFTLTSNIIKRGGPKTENFKTTVGIRPKE
jgi:type II secretory pathway pseudopilin PulG